MLERLQAGGWSAASSSARAGVTAWLAGQQGARGKLRLGKRLINSACVSAGLEADGRGRWAVARVIGWRGSFRNREDLVEWSGFDTERNMPWPNSWVARSRLTADLRVEGKIRPARAKRAAATQAPVIAGMRKSPRLAGVTPIDGLERDSRRLSSGSSVPDVRVSDSVGIAHERMGGERKRIRRFGGLDHSEGSPGVLCDRILRGMAAVGRLSWRRS